MSRNASGHLAALVTILKGIPETIRAENSTNPKTVMDRLDHKDIGTTINRYVFKSALVVHENISNSSLNFYFKLTHHLE